MIRNIRIETMDQLMELIGEKTYRPELKRYRDLCIYRGECDSGFTLSTSLMRNCKSRASHKTSGLVIFTADGAALFHSGAGSGPDDGTRLSRVEN